MKLILAALAIAGLLTGPAEAQNANRDKTHEGHRSDQDRPPPQGQAPAAQTPRPQHSPPNMQRSAPRPQMGKGDRLEATPGNTPKNRPDLRLRGEGRIEHTTPNRRAQAVDRDRAPDLNRTPDRRPDFHRDRGIDRDRRDFGNLRGNFHAERRFHAGPWRPPHDYHYRRWHHGQRLPSLYFNSGLWITSFGLYGLMAPPPDTVWVRSGPDALLVDRYSGEIIRVQYGVFY